jgi:hypothetical protein
MAYSRGNCLSGRHDSDSSGECADSKDRGRELNNKLIFCNVQLGPDIRIWLRDDISTSEEDESSRCRAMHKMAQFFTQ